MSSLPAVPEAGGPTDRQGRFSSITHFRRQVHEQVAYAACLLRIGCSFLPPAKDGSNHTLAFFAAGSDATLPLRPRQS
jgi:hypothetical protein